MRSSLHRLPLTINMEIRTDLSKYIKGTTPKFFLYDLNFQKLVEEHAIETEEYQSRRVDLVLKSPSKNW